MKLSTTKVGQEWLSQFRFKGQYVARSMLDAFDIVSSDEFHLGMRNLITSLCEKSDRPIAFYLLKDLEHCELIYDYERREDGVCRAAGEGPSPFSEKHKKPDSYHVTMLLLEILEAVQKDYPNLLINPGADIVRKNKVRQLCIVTDFVGSGRSVREYLYKMWKIPTIRSWHSSKLISTEVVAYAMTEKGKTSVEWHRSRPKTHYFLKAKSLFDYNSNTRQKNKAASLCQNYRFLISEKYQNSTKNQKEKIENVIEKSGSRDKELKILERKVKKFYERYYDEDFSQKPNNNSFLNQALELLNNLSSHYYEEEDSDEQDYYYEPGREDKRQFRMSLIAFEHGFPASVPRIFRSNEKGWKALFPLKNEAETGKKSHYLDITLLKEKTILDKKFDLLNQGEGLEPFDDFTLFFEDEIGQRLYFALQSLDRSQYKKRMRQEDNIAGFDMKDIFSYFKKEEWISAQGFYLTDKGRKILRKVHNSKENIKTLCNDEQKGYYPTQLRVLAQS